MTDRHINTEVSEGLQFNIPEDLKVLPFSGYNWSKDNNFVGDR